MDTNDEVKDTTIEELVSSPSSNETTGALRKYVTRELLHGGSSSKQFFAVDKLDDSGCSTKSGKMSPSQKFTVDDLASNHDDSDESSIASSQSDSSDDLHSSQFNLGNSHSDLNDEDYKQTVKTSKVVESPDRKSKRKSNEEFEVVEMSIRSADETRPTISHVHSDSSNDNDDNKVENIGCMVGLLPQLSYKEHPNSPVKTVASSEVLTKSLPKSPNCVIVEKIVEVPVPVKTETGTGIGTITVTHVVLITLGAFMLGFMGGRKSN